MSEAPQPYAIATGSGALLQRESELAVIDEAVMNAKADESQLLLIEGAAGIGKSRLLQEACARAEKSGFVVLKARGNEFETEFAWGVVRQLRDAVDSEGQRHLAEQSGFVADRALDALRIVDSGEEAAGSVFSVLDGLYWSVSQLTELGPLMIAVDDIQWSDRPSLEFIAYFARRMESLPVMVVATARTAAGALGGTVVRELMSDPARVSLQPRPLGTPAVSELVRARFGSEPDEAFSQVVTELTGGNPLLLVELLHELAAEGVSPTGDSVEHVRELGPRAASRSVLLRLARLGPECASVARALAVLGESTVPELVAKHCGLDESVTLAATEQLVHAEIIGPDTPVSFVHPLVREAIYRDIPPAEREQAHRRAAELFDAIGAAPERIAGQLIHVSPSGSEWLVDRLCTAAHEAAARGAHPSSVAYLSRALEEPPPLEHRQRVIRDLAIAEAMANSPVAIEHTAEAHALSDDPAERARLALILIRLQSYAARANEVADIGTRAIADLGDARPDLQQRLEIALCFNSLIGAPTRPYERLEEVLADDRSRGETLEARMYDGLLAYGRALDGESAERAVEVAMRALKDDSLMRTDYAGFSLMGVLLTLLFADDDRVFDAIDRALVSVRSNGPLFGPAVMHSYKGLANALRGDLASAYEELELARADVEVFNIEIGYAQVSAMLGTTGVEAGDFERAERDLAWGERYTSGGIMTTAWLGSKLALRVEQSRYDEALALCEQLIAQSDPRMLRNPAWLPWRSLKAEALDGLGRSEEALVLAAEELELTRRWGSPRPLGRALRVVGQLKRGDGLPELEESVAVLENSPNRLELGWSLAALGTWLRLNRQNQEARVPLGRALDLAERGGAKGLERHARDELAATGAAPRTAEFSGMAALTSSERRIAALAVEGLTNREIAHSLFVTPKTVEVHLTSVYKKLDVKSRRELPAVFESSEA